MQARSSSSSRTDPLTSAPRGRPRRACGRPPAFGSTGQVASGRPGSRSSGCTRNGGRPGSPAISRQAACSYTVAGHEPMPSAHAASGHVLCRAPEVPHHRQRRSPVADRASRARWRRAAPAMWPPRARPSTAARASPGRGPPRTSQRCVVLGRARAPPRIERWSAARPRAGRSVLERADDALVGRWRRGSP